MNKNKKTTCILNAHSIVSLRGKVDFLSTQTVYTCEHMMRVHRTFQTLFLSFLIKTLWFDH